MEESDPGHISQTRTHGKRTEAIPVSRGREADSEYKKEYGYDPTHPDADKDGM